MKKHLILEIEPRGILKIFLTFWLFESHFLINYFLIQKEMYLFREQFNKIHNVSEIISGFP